MIKTEMQIERDFYSFVKDSDLGKAIKGGIYRSEMRPANSVSEDLIVKLLAGVEGQVQTGVILLNIYVPDITLGDGQKVADKRRIGELEELIISFVESAGGTEYLLETDVMPTTMLNAEIEQHLITARIKFQRITF